MQARRCAVISIQDRLRSTPPAPPPPPSRSFLRVASSDDPPLSSTSTTNSQDSFSASTADAQDSCQSYLSESVDINLQYCHALSWQFVTSQTITIQKQHVSRLRHSEEENGYKVIARFIGEFFISKKRMLQKATTGHAIHHIRGEKILTTKSSSSRERS
jgi:hypothetical protein